MNKSSAIKPIKKFQPAVIIGFYFLHQKDGLKKLVPVHRQK